MEEAKIKKEKTATVFLPLDRENTSPLFVSVNDRTWYVKRGEPVEVPLCVKEIIDYSLHSDAEALAYEQKVSGGAV